MKINDKMIKYKVTMTTSSIVKYIVNMGGNAILTIIPDSHHNHVAVSVNKDRPPTYHELDYVKNNFFYDDEPVVMSFPDSTNVMVIMGHPGTVYD